MSKDLNLYIALDIDAIVSSRSYTQIKDFPARIPEGMLHALLFNDKSNTIDQVTNNLVLNNVERGSYIYWSLIKLPSYSDYYSAVLTNYTTTETDQERIIMSKPTLSVRTVTTSFIKDDDTKEIGSEKIKDNYWSSKVKSTGDIMTQSYTGYITIFNSDGSLVGYSSFNHSLILNPPKK
ncbi:inclusion body family protein [Xenorhabdus bovienii]|uniref:AidA/PixA family protein n=1 Tax=Xenorhabdus bovienii TaxID=40576 RepID=UPI0023B330E2|nr:AidA/PixA family protein [Xenorhabdus bovienii]MDE9447858.1 inclusion body family protein [Xenorhabdus bovienii]